MSTFAPSMSLQVTEQSSKEMGRGSSAAAEGSSIRKGGECRQDLAFTLLGLHAGQQAQVYAGQVGDI